MGQQVKLGIMAASVATIQVEWIKGRHLMDRRLVETTT